MPTNPVTMVLEGNGSLQGRDRAGIFSATGSGALRYAPAAGARTNLALRPQMDVGGSDYNVTSTYTADGWREITTATGDGGYILSTFSPFSAATYTIGFDAYAVSGLASNYDLSVGYYHRDGSGSSGVERIDFVPTAGVQRFVLSFTATAHGYLRLQFRRKNTGVTGVFAVRNLTVEAGATDGSWFSSSAFLNPITGALGSLGTTPSVSRAAFWVEESTTNTVPNPRAETNTTGWTSYSDRTLVRDTTRAYIGSACVKVTADVLVSGENYVCSITGVAITANVAHTASAYVFIPTAYTGGAFCLDVRGYASGAGRTYVDADLGVRDRWQRIVVPFTSTGGDTTADIHFTTRAGFPAGNILYMTNVQVEAKSYATSYTDGALGTGYAWVGTAHASASTRTAAVIEMDATGRAFSALGSMVARSQSLYTASDYRRLVEIGRYGTDPVSIVLLNNNIRIRIENWENGSPSATVSVANAVTAHMSRKAYAAWTAAQLKVQMDDGALASGARVADGSGGFSAGNQKITVGSFTGSSGSFNLCGYAGSIAIYETELSDAEIARVNTVIDGNGQIGLWGALNPWPSRGSFSSRLAKPMREALYAGKGGYAS